MQTSEALIPSATGGGYLLRLFNVLVDEGERKFRDHRHVEFEIVLIKSGSGVYRTKDKEYSIRAGDVFLFASNEVHCITAIDKGGMRLMNIHFEPRFIWSSGNDLFDADYLRIFYDRSENFENRLPRGSAQTENIARMLMNMEQEFNDKKPEYTLMVKVQLLSILVTMMRGFDYVSAEDKGQGRRQSYAAIERSMDYMMSRLSEPLTLAQLAKVANMSETYYSAVFSRLNGVSPWDYLTAKRVEKAANLLRSEKGLTMLEIAMQCGFNNTANFNRAFKKYQNRTPSSYRKSSLIIP